MAVEKPKTAAGKQPIRVELVPMNGVMPVMRRKAVKWLAMAGIGFAAAYGAGDCTQSNFRDTFGYDPDVPVADGVSPGPDTKEEEPDGLLDRAKRAATKWTKSQVEKIGDMTGLTAAYKELKATYDALLGMVDTAAFWVPFILTFMSMVWVLEKMVALKKALSQTVDPTVERNIQMLAAAVNEIGARLDRDPNLSREELGSMVERVQGLSVALQAVENAVVSGKRT